LSWTLIWKDKEKGKPINQRRAHVASFQINNVRHDIALVAMQQVEAVLAEKAGAELCDVTIDLTAGKVHDHE
jgi:hypothetical protein